MSNTKSCESTSVESQSSGFARLPRFTRGNISIQRAKITQSLSSNKSPTTTTFEKAAGSKSWTVNLFEVMGPGESNPHNPSDKWRSEPRKSYSRDIHGKDLTDHKATCNLVIDLENLSEEIQRQEGRKAGRRFPRSRGAIQNLSRQYL